MEFLVSIGSSVLSGIITTLIERVVEKLQDEWVRSRPNLHDAVQALQASISKVKELIADAEKRAYFNDDAIVKDWVTTVRDAMYDADDVLDELEYKKLKRSNKESKLANYYHKHSPFKVFERVITKKINSMNKRFTTILKEAETYNLEWSDMRDANAQSRATSSILGNETEFFGREGIRDHIVQLLTQEDMSVDDKYILSIIGIGGIGKTTLAQMVYNHDKVQSKFDLRIWVCVSDVFNEQRIIKQILESIYHSSERTMTGWNYENADVLANTLVKELEGKKCILFLDDVWNEDPIKWEHITRCFDVANEKKRSRLVVTTRSKLAANAIKSSEIIPLDGLSDDALWALFKKCAFGVVNEPQLKLEKIGRNIMNKLKGSPLAAKTVGRILSTNLDEKHWNNILNNEIWKLAQNEKEIMPALRLSYEYLPEYLKPCFAFFSLYPKDYIYNKRKIVAMWISLGYIQSHNGGELMEEIGEQYVNELLNRFMLESCNENNVAFVAKILLLNASEMFRIHDLVHDIAKMVSKNESLTIHDEYTLKQLSPSIRNVSIVVDDMEWSWNEDSCFDHLNKIRTLIFLHKDKMRCQTNGQIPQGFYNFLRKLLSKMKYLRILDLGFLEIEELPLPKLKHLRYLDLHKNKIEKLPSTLAYLYHLQFLDCEGASGDSWIAPPYINALVNLRRSTGLFFAMVAVPNPGKFRFLQQLEFVVTKQDKLKALQDMKELRELRLIGLENVRSKEEAWEAGLKSMVHLNKLTIVWSPGSHVNNVEEVLEALHPNTNLSLLTMYRYPGAECSSWMEKLSFLRVLLVAGCPFIKYIRTRRLERIKRLLFSDCESLGIEDGFEGFQALTSLEELYIDRCPQLVADLLTEGRGGLPSSLKDMLIVYEGNAAINVSSSITQSLTNLTRLVVDSHLSKSGSITPSATSPPMTQQLQQLREFSLFCHSAQELKGWLLHLRGCTALVEMVLACTDVETFDTEMEDALVSFHSLDDLWLEGFTMCRSLPTRLCEVSSLRELTIVDCPKIDCLPKGGLEGFKRCRSLPTRWRDIYSQKWLTIPAGLQLLHHWGCPLLEKYLEEEPQDLGGTSVRSSYIQPRVVD